MITKYGTKMCFYWHKDKTAMEFVRVLRKSYLISRSIDTIVDCLTIFQIWLHNCLIHYSRAKKNVYKYWMHKLHFSYFFCSIILSAKPVAIVSQTNFIADINLNDQHTCDIIAFSEMELCNLFVNLFVEKCNGNFSNK